MRILDCVFKRGHASFTDPGSSTGILKQPNNEYRLHYTVSGTGFIRINDSKYLIRNDCLFVTYPGDIYTIGEQGTEVPFTCYLISFNVDTVDNDLRELMHGPAFERRYLFPGRNLRFLLDEILYAFGSKHEHSRVSCEHYLLGFLFSISNSATEEVASASSISYIEKSVEIMGSKVRQSLTLGELCTELNITEPHFIRLFKAYMGVSPMKYFMSLKVEEASSLLAETNLRIYQIADALCFSSETHFSRTFKQYKCMTPMNYRIGQIQSINTRRDRSERELEYANKMIQTIIDATPDLIFYKNTEGIYLWCNDAFGRLVGLPKEKILGRSDFEIFPKHLAEFFHEKDRNIYRYDKAIKNEEWLLFPDGDRRKYEVYKAPLHDSDGTILGLLGISRDIMEREEAIGRLTEAKAEQESANRQKGDFLFTMSEGIITSIENIRREMASPIVDRREISSTENVQFECDYLTVLAEEIIAFTRFESGEEKPNISGFSLEELCARLRKSLYNKYTQFNIDLRLRLNEGIPKIVFGDELRLYHLLLLLITTAIKYSQQGLIKIDGTYANQVATIKIRISKANFSAARAEPLARKTDIVGDQQAFFLTSSDLSLAIAEKHLKMMNGHLTLRKIATDQVEFVVDIALPGSVENRTQSYPPTPQYL